MIVFENSQQLISVHEEAGRPLRTDQVASLAEVSQELQALHLDERWVLADLRCRICGYEETALIPLVADLDDCECAHCGNMTADEKDEPEWWQEE